MGMTNPWVTYLEVQALPPGLLDSLREWCDRPDFDEKVSNSVLERALIISTELGHLDIVQLILQKEAVDVNAKVNGVTALHVAVLKGGADIAELLLRFRADVNAEVEETGWVVLHYAVVRGNVAMAELLLRFRADVNAEMKETGWTALHFAAFCGHVAMAEVLTGFGADVNAKTERTRHTALHYAAMSQNADLVELLTKHGADVNAKDAKARTPIAIAFDSYQMGMVKSMWNALYLELQDLEEDTNSPVLSELQEAFAGKEHHLAATIFKYIRPVNFEDLELANKDRDSTIELLKPHYDDLHKYVKILRKAKEQQLQRGTKRKVQGPAHSLQPQATVTKKPEIRYP